MNSDARKKLYNERLDDHEVDTLYNIIEATSKILDDNDIRYTIEGGTLLGAVRNGGLIPHDNDADFDVLESDLDKIRSLKNEFAKHNLVIIEVPGWGLQISHKDSPDLEPNMWSDNNGNYWTSKWPFLDLISISYDEEKNFYCLAQNVAKYDYPKYYLSRNDWEQPFEKIQFGHLSLWVIGGHDNRIAYLDRNYKNWSNKLEMVMDHRKNVYFDKPLVCDITEADLYHRKHSDHK